MGEICHIWVVVKICKENIYFSCVGLIGVIAKTNRLCSIFIYVNFSVNFDIFEDIEFKSDNENGVNGDWRKVGIRSKNKS